MLSIFTVFDIQIRQQSQWFVLFVMYIHAHIEIQIHARFLAIGFAIEIFFGLHGTFLDGIGKVMSSPRAFSFISLKFYDFSYIILLLPSIFLLEW